MTGPGAQRDTAREEAFFRSVRPVGADRFVEHATSRLEEGERKFGDSWKTLSLEEFVLELAEEAVDLAAWGALARQVLDFSELPDDARARVAGLLGSIARSGAYAHLACEALSDLLKEVRSP